MKKRGRIIPFFFFAVLVAIFVSLTFPAFFQVLYEWHRFQQESETFRQQVIDSRKNRLRQAVTEAVDIIGFRKDRIKKRLMADIKSRVYTAHAIAENIYEQNRHRPSAEIGELVKNALRPIRFNDGKGYYFAVSMDGVEKLYPVHPEMEGKNLINLKDLKGNLVIQDEIEVVRQSGEGYVTDYWPKPGGKALDTGYPKISFVKHFKPLDWYIGTGLYLDDVKSEIQAETIERLRQKQLPENVFLFAFKDNGVPLWGQDFLPGEKNASPPQAGNSTRGYFAQLERAAQSTGGFVRCRRPEKSGTPAGQRIDYVRRIPDWQWVVGAGMYLDDVDAAIA
ncbi:MAG: cache domain-containing protein, partial [Thermodesulfobacteriota bacterium]